ncbi:MAG: metallophosphoesterase [Syntrophobacteraceae bacterium]
MSEHDAECESSSSGATISRRRFLKMGLCAATLTGMGVACAHGYTNGSCGLEDISVERVAMPVKDLPLGLDRFKIVQMSDFHFDSYTRMALMESAIDAANRLEPDIVVLTGDYITSDVKKIHDLSQVLRRLRPRIGVFGVLGNHDVAHGPKVVQKGLEKAGVTVLRNRGVEFDVGGDSIHLAGLDDALHGRPNFKAAMAEHTEGTPSVLLMHEPDYADRVVGSELVSVQLSGHSHGGQVRLPGIGALCLPIMGRKYDHGLYRLGKAWLYTNRGIGAVTVPVRIGCPPEVTEITLLSQNAATETEA